MTRLNLYKIILFFEGLDVMKLIAAVSKSMTEENVRKKIVSELYSNFVESYNITWNEKDLDSCIKDASVQKLGTLETKDPLLKDVEDFSFLLLQKK